MTADSTSRPVRTRFAPSPTGYLHLGGARTALFSWAFARHFGGTFVLRIEDTDLERSTPAAVQAILDGMNWLGLQHDDGPYYQMQRIARYREVIAEMMEKGTAYYCYSSPEEVEAMREKMRQAGDKPRYDGTWRPEPGKTLPPVPAERKPVVRFRNPVGGAVVWDDLVKGTISIANEEMDDLIIARPDGTPTYNFCVVVDDYDMGITHVIRGDDHVNNTPRQINILSAIGATVPLYGHVPMILGADGEKLSKRHGAVSVMDYPAQGYLPEAMLNYLARLGWSHGDDEIFSMEQFCSWFDLNHLSRSPAQFNPEKLDWVNNHYIKAADNERLAQLITPMLVREDIAISAEAVAQGPSLPAMIGMMKERANTLLDIARTLPMFYRDPQPAPDLLATHMTSAAKAALAEYATLLADVSWDKASLAAAIKQVLATHALKMPQLAMPLRLLLTGQLQTPAVDVLQEAMGRDLVQARIARFID